MKKFLGLTMAIFIFLSATPVFADINYNDYEWLDSGIISTFSYDLGEDAGLASYTVNFTDVHPIYEDGYCLSVTFDVEFVAKTGSPIYTSNLITAKVDYNNTARFNWVDSWENSGYGTLVINNDNQITLNMSITDLAKMNRGTLETNGDRVLYKEWGDISFQPSANEGVYLKIFDESKTIAVGETVQIGVYTYNSDGWAVDNQQVQWSAVQLPEKDNTDVILLGDTSGYLNKSYITITGMGIGACALTAKIGDASATCQIEVVDPNIYVIDESNYEERGFDITCDGWCFVNEKISFGYEDNDVYKIPEERYVEVYGESIRPYAKDYIGEWGGNCFGMCVTALKAYEGKIEINPNKEINEIYDIYKKNYQ